MYLWIRLWQEFGDEVETNNWFLTLHNLLVQSDWHLKNFKSFPKLVFNSRDYSS